MLGGAMFGGIAGWFSNEGRISRKGYCLQVVLPGAVFAALVPAINLFGGVLGGPLRSGYSVVLMAIVMASPLLLPAILLYSQRASALTIRRYHDLGKKGPWHIRAPGMNLAFLLLAMPVAGVIFIVAYLLVIAALMTSALSVGVLVAMAAIVVALIGFGLWTFYQLACKPGMRGDNEYGPDPLDRPPSGGAPPPASPAPMVERVAPRPAGATFGRKRA